MARQSPSGVTYHDVRVLVVHDLRAIVVPDADVRPGDTIAIGALSRVERVVSTVASPSREGKVVGLRPRGTVFAPAIAFEDLHPDVQAAARKLYDDGHYAEAVSKAYLVLELAVRARSGLPGSGRGLMASAFADSGPIDVRAHQGQTGDDEQAGFRFLFMGAAAALRNPRAHELIEDDSQTALMHLVLVSLLMQRLDTAQRRGGKS